ncbi:MAG: sigma-54 dependent transcriptional regulator [Blastocatellia bacterium]|nr:sigma-54 dependent transcriptional regulator [Blastocatellia bacterium]
MKQEKILLLDFDVAGRMGGVLEEILGQSFCLSVRSEREMTNSCDLAFDSALADFDPAVVFFALPRGLQQGAGRLLQAIKSRRPQTPLIAAIEEGEPKATFELLESGAADFITPPLKAGDVLPRVWRLLRQADREPPLTQTLKERLGLKQLIGESRKFLTEIKKIPLVARCNAGVLITGETGTGKELCARAIHYLSPRSHKPFIPINCGAIPLDLVENELFGHQRGAFTGAVTSQPGLVAEADGGTLFLDEVTCLPSSAQVKLLRFLQEKEYRPLGSTKTLRADIRMIAATNADCEKALLSGALRRDLYYRLNIIQLALPPLSERREDIPLLANHFLVKYAAEFDKPVTGFSPDAMQAFLLYDWPGNVRELEHTIQRALVLSEGSLIEGRDIFLPESGTAARQESFQEMKSRVVGKFEKSYIQGLLLAHKGNITQAAQAAQKNRRAFWQLIRKHHIDAQRFKPDPS